VQIVALGGFAKIVGLKALLYLSKSTASTVLAGSNDMGVWAQGLTCGM